MINVFIGTAMKVESIIMLSSAMCDGASPIGMWDSAGCRLIPGAYHNTQSCVCNHLTDFALEVVCHCILSVVL